MQPQQQRFWPDPQPLVQRLGRAFFRHLPAAPGVYLMHGAANTVLYVGKAKSLRHRLGSYRVANPERMKRRTLRLLGLVERIAWEECADESAALRREAELLLTLKPRFNRAGVWPGPKHFLAWRPRPGGLELAVVPAPEDGWSAVGPFGAQVRHLHRALVRLLWCRFHPDASLAGMPAGWLEGGHGSRVLLPAPSAELAAEAARHLIGVVAGNESEFPKWLPPPAAYAQTIQDEDLDFVIKHLAGAGKRGRGLDLRPQSSASISASLVAAASHLRVISASSSAL